MTDPTKLVDPAVEGINSNEEGASLTKQLDIHASLLKLAVNQNDKRLVSRVIHHLPSFVNSLDIATIAEFSFKYSADNEICSILAVIPNGKLGHVKDKSLVVELYCWLLLVCWLSKRQSWTQLFSISPKLFNFLAALQHRSVFDGLLAKMYFYISLAFEKEGQLIDLRHHLMVVLRTASLRHDSETYAVVYNWILRSYIFCEQHDLASKFVEKSPFFENANNAQICRYHYYMARIGAVQTRYEEAAEHLVQALRKAPHTDSCIGLIQSANKLLVVVQLLLGIMTERSLFSQPKIAKSLKPYLALAQAVRLGDLSRFQKVLQEHQARFLADRNYSIVTRLHQNVLRTGLKRLNVAYSRIPLADVCVKLGLPSVDDAEFVVMKAIKDNVINAFVDHANQYVQSISTVNAYYTREPQEILDQRVQTAQDIYKQSVRALRYPQGISKAATRPVDLDVASNEPEMFDEYMDADDGMDF